MHLLKWLESANCSVVGMESTGVYWKPVHHILSTRCEVVLGNSREIRQRPGKKTDKADATWIAELLAHDLITPSFVPPPGIAALRDLTRTRIALVQSRTQAKNRVHKLLEDTNIKLASVATDIFGKSGRRIMEALIAGEAHPSTLANMALGLLRRKRGELELALHGNFTTHHAKLLRLSLDLIDELDRQIQELDEEIGRAIKPYETEIMMLDSIPGIDQIAARDIIAEIGTDMQRFGSSARLASWAGVCPGNNESAGKRKSGKTRKGSKWLRRTLTQCAWAARKTDTYLGRRFSALERRLGGKKAAVAIAHQILVIVWHLLREGTLYEEKRYGLMTQQQEERRLKRHVEELKRLGYNVTLEKAA
jgi:transposase